MKDAFGYMGGWPSVRRGLEEEQQRVDDQRARAACRTLAEFMVRQARGYSPDLMAGVADEPLTSTITDIIAASQNPQVRRLNRR